MNRICPVCETDLLESGPVPLEDNDKIGTLCFCSESCREQYIDEELDRDLETTTDQ